MDAVNLVAVAHHEIGHAALAYRVGAGDRIAEIVLDMDDREEGCADIDTKGLPFDRQLIIAVAGPLAEVKCYAFQQVSCEVYFDIREYEDLVQSAYEEDDRVQVIYFLEKNASQSFPARMIDNCSSDFDDLSSNEYFKRTINKETFSGLIKQTMKCLDEPDLWNAVRSGADELIQTKRISGERFRDEMKRMGIKPI